MILSLFGAQKVRRKCAKGAQSAQIFFNFCDNFYTFFESLRVCKPP